MAGNNDYLSQEGLKQLSKTINEAKGLLDRQLEVVEKVLEYEEKLGKLKIGYLEDYFDIYSKKLKDVTTKQSDLGETFLAYESQLQKFENEVNKAKKTKTSSGNISDNDVADISKRGSGGSSSGSSSNNVSNMDRGELDPVENKGLTQKEIDDAMSRKVKSETRLLEMRKLDRLNTEQFETKMAEKKAEWETKLTESRVKRWNDIGAKEEALYNKQLALEALKNENKNDTEDRATVLSLINRDKTTDAQLESQSLINGIKAEAAYLTSDYAASELTQLALATEDARAIHELQKQWDAEREELIFQAKLKNNGILEEADMKAINEIMVAKMTGEENIQKRIENIKKKKQEEERRKKEREDRAKNKYGKITSLDASSFENYSARERLMDLRTARDEQMQKYIDEGANVEDAKIAASIKVLTETLSSLAQELDKTMNEIASKKGAIDTRLQGSNNEKVLGSYWDRLVKDMTAVGAVNPFFKQEKFAQNIETLVSKGIAFDLKQRAFLMTVSDKIANTFEVSNNTLLRLVRIQQEDSTAGRLGMESALNSFLNNMYETSEYLSDVASSVRTSLEEMESLMSGAEATEVEFQVQKWLGSLYSVGMSQNATQSIADALGKIAAGDIDGLTNGGAGNLLIMAANDAGLSIADILTDGINSSDTNKLLQAAVKYLAELSDSAADNRVVQQQLANVFGVKASDLRAATNLITNNTVSDIFGESLTYDNMLRQLYKMASTMGMRTSVGEMMGNVWDNVQYTLAGSMASSPVSYMVYKMAGLLESATGGIDIGLPMIMGNGLPVQFKVSDLMRAAAMTSGILGTLPQLINGLVSSTNGALMLASLGISTGSGLKATPRGTIGGLGALEGGGSQTTSGSGYIGNGSGSDIKDSTIQENEDSAKKQMIEAQEEAEGNQIDILNQTVVKIYELLDDVSSGKSTFHVKVEGYGLTKAGGGSSANGGVQGLSGGSSLNNSGNVSGSVDFGGWTTV